MQTTNRGLHKKTHLNLFRIYLIKLAYRKLSNRNKVLLAQPTSVAIRKEDSSFLTSVVKSSIPHAEFTKTITE